MIFTRLDNLFSLVPIALLILLFKWRKKKNFFSHPLLFYLREKIRPASSIVHLPSALEYLTLGSLILALLNPILPSAEQEVMIGFVQKRHTDRIGIVVFSENGYVVAPMTGDTHYLSHYLRMVDNKTLASEGQTAIGEGILTALHLARQQSRDKSGSRGKLMVVLTDGENNTGRDLYTAIRQASEAGFKIHFIGVELERAPDAPRLIAAVKATGGSYYDVRDAQQLEQAYHDINRLEKTTYLTQDRLSQVPYFYPFALAAVLFLAASIALRAIPYFIEIS